MDMTTYTAATYHKDGSKSDICICNDGHSRHDRTFSADGFPTWTCRCCNFTTKRIVRVTAKKAAERTRMSELMSELLAEYHANQKKGD